ncbi:hypothetical protein [Paucibacter soli]|uniref:hypothetical protein n=1 Tax=Paucibacter soli TaxID=3133433 RepID=UPI0030A8FD90
MLLAELFAGAGTGLLLGLLLGLSASPVVGVVVGALAALLASLIGLRLPGKADAATEAPGPAQRRASHWRAAVFSLLCIVGLLSGLYVRTHDLLSPAPRSLRAQVDELTALGFSAAEARRIVVLHKLDDSPVPAPASASNAMPGKSLLFAAQAERCERLNPERFKDLAATVAAYRAMDEPALARVAQAISNQAGDEAARMDLLKAVLEAVCAKP